MHQDPPRNGEGDQPQAGGGVPAALVAPIKTVRRARKLRRTMSLPEVLLWQALRLRPCGLKFRRQYPCDVHVADFACLEARLAIEVDGEAHNRGNRPVRDESRDRALAAAGLAILHIPAADVLTDLDGVLVRIVAVCGGRGPLHQPSAGPPPRAGEDLA